MEAYKKYGKKCKHWPGLRDALGKTTVICKAGIDVRSFTEKEAWLKRIPCCEFNENVTPCDKCEFPTYEELDEDLSELRKAMDKVIAMHEKGGVIESLKKKYPDGGGEVVECPDCSGRLHISISGFNGHAHGKCETDNCFNFME